MSEYIKIPTTPEVWAVIHASHKKTMEVFASFSDPSGTFQGGPGEVGRMETGYGLRGTDYPILWARTTWTIKPDGSTSERESEYWICVARAQE